MAGEIFDECFTLMKSRNDKYGDSWKTLDVANIAGLIEMKMNRIAKLGVVETKVIDSRLAEQGKVIRRRRECEKCARRVTSLSITGTFITSLNSNAMRVKS